jgi:hypothetical protein
MDIYQITLGILDSGGAFFALVTKLHQPTASNPYRSLYHPHECELVLHMGTTPALQASSFTGTLEVLDGSDDPLWSSHISPTYSTNRISRETQAEACFRIAFVMGIWLDSRIFVFSKEIFLE